MTTNAPTYVSFRIPGEPRGKGRPRFVRATGRAYTPAATESYEATCRLFASQAMAGNALLACPVALEVVVTKAIPTSWSKKKKTAAASNNLLPCTKPDLTNIIKSVEDALNGVVYADDKQIVRICASQQYGALPGVSVKVCEIAYDRRDVQ